MEIQVIEPKKRKDTKLKVCAYARVSTETEEQENSLENQISHYKEEISNNSAYEYVGVYYDFGISGFKEKRPGFQRMVQDARDGKINLIITKSVSRFARNTVTVLKVIRELKDMGVGIFFELQNINTLTEEGELLLTLLSAFAQAESEAARVGAQMIYRRKYEKGEAVQYLDHSFGYTKSKNGEFIPYEKEAKWVRKMYQLAANGYTVAEIRRYLNKNGVKTVKGAKFIDSTVIRILENEIYQGDYIMHKHYVNENRKLVKNEGQVDAWYVKNDHKPIVSRKLWERTQEKIKEKRKYLAKGSVVGELNVKTYPYMNKLFCADCGYPLYRRVYSNGNRVCWQCSGKKRYNHNFCKGVNIPDVEVKNRKIENNVYISEKKNAKGFKEYSFISERDWKEKGKKKKHRKDIPELNEKNYPYWHRLFCRECGGRLTRCTPNDKVYWVCNTWKRKGKKECSGVRIADEIVRTFKDIDNDIYIYKTKEGFDYSEGRK